MIRLGLLTFAVCVMLTMGAVTRVSGASELTAEKRVALEEGNVDKADYILMDLQKEYEKSGPEVLKPYIPSLLTGARRLLRHPGKSKGEAEGEMLGDYIWLLSKTGDPSTRSFFLELMVSHRVGGLMVAEGLLNLGRSVLPAIEDSLSSPRPQSRFGAANYLGPMVRMDSTGVFFTPEDRKRIAKRLLTFLDDADERVRMGAVQSLGEVGDLQALPALAEIQKNDPYKEPNGVFIIRVRAEQAIERIKEREIQSKRK